MSPETERTLVCVTYYLSGLGSWLIVSGLFAEGGYLALHTPEGLTLFAKLDFIIQFGNIAPAAIVLLASSWARHNSSLLVCGLLGLALTTLLVLTQAWSVTVGGTSVILLGSAAAAGVVGTTSMVVLFPWAAQSPHSALAVGSLSAGVGSCGVATHLLSGFQGLALGRTPLLFSASTYFALLGSIQLLSTAAFITILVKLPPAVYSSSESYQQLAGDDEDEFSRPSLVGGADTAEGSAADGMGIAAAAADGAGDVTACATKASWGRGAARLMRATRAKMPAYSSECNVPFVAIFISCFTEFATPGLLPYLFAPENRTTSRLFALTSGYLCSSVFGRVVTVVNGKWQRANASLLFGIGVIVQTAIFIYLLGATHGAVPPLPPQLAVPLVVLFSFAMGS
eukprot:CAMPEP_0118939144 /NCGR_PEP_ID=MMETSP1169-20130426/28083_1 /TAXON_ID=36882 /ORGANISM="Pyramimonas obovata, Strain CCMP722" /LENGTH=396 /DNA_ID=CAMNT_0006883337 /DNA_START=125 /DNA_END=1319 /DNA_ORIENTATION=-